MRIISVRVRKLVSGPGYNNTAVEAEAVVVGDESPEEVHENLTAWVEGRIRGEREAAEIRASRSELYREVGELERRRDNLRGEIDANRKLIRAHADLHNLAVKNGIDLDGLSDGIPF